MENRLLTEDELEGILEIMREKGAVLVSKVLKSHIAALEARIAKKDKALMPFVLVADAIPEIDPDDKCGYLWPTAGDMRRAKEARDA